VRAALQQELDAEALPLDDRPVQRRHVELVVAVRVGPGRDQVGDVEQLGVAHEHSFLQLSLQRRDLLRLAVDTRPVHLVERPSGRAHGARSEARAHAHAPQRREASGAPPPLRKCVCCQFPPPPAAPRARAVTRTPRLSPLPRVCFHGSLLLKIPGPRFVPYIIITMIITGHVPCAPSRGRTRQRAPRDARHTPGAVCVLAGGGTRRGRARRAPWDAGLAGLRDPHEDQGRAAAPGSGRRGRGGGWRVRRGARAGRERLCVGHGRVVRRGRRGAGRGTHVQDDQGRRQRRGRLVLCRAAQVHGLQARGVRGASLVSARVLRI
jgi:hypothetical protein